MTSRGRVVFGGVLATGTLVAVIGSLAIGALRANDSGSAEPWRDALELVVGTAFAAMAGALVVAATAPLRGRRSQATEPEADARMALELGIAALVAGAAFATFFAYVFGGLGVAIRSAVAASFSP